MFKCPNVNVISLNSSVGRCDFLFSLDANLHMTDKYRCLIHKKHNATDENI